MEEAVFLKGDEIKEEVGKIEIEPTLNEYNEIVYALELKIYQDDCGFVPEPIRSGNNILGEVFSARWGWRDYDGSVKKECRMRKEIFKTKEDAEQEAREIIKLLEKNYEEYLKKKRQIERERKVIRIYL